MIALLEAQRAGLFGRAHWLRNILSGVIVGVVALPLAMAFAIASGARPEQGLYTAIVAGGAVSAFGGSRVQIAGPTGAFIVILAGITSRYGIAGLQVATIMAGIMLLALGLARMGGIIRFIPDPVITGFTAGIAIIIWVGQWGDFFGLQVVAGQHFHDKLYHLALALMHPHWTTTMLAAGSLAAVVLGPRLPNVPTTKEQGMNTVFRYNLGYWAPLGTPRDIVAKLNAATGEALKTPNAREKIAAMSLIPNHSTPEELLRLQQLEASTYGEAAKLTGFQPQ